MKVRNVVSWSGVNFSHAPGDVLDLPGEMAEARIAAGLAEPAPEDAAAKEHPAPPPSAAEEGVRAVAAAMQPRKKGRG